jgi:hypothetical protein
MLALALVYLALLSTFMPLTGSQRSDGIVSILLGLYVCSHPIANGLDVLLFRRYLPDDHASTWSTVFYWGFNVLVLFFGWLVISAGMLRLAAR